MEKELNQLHGTVEHSFDNTIRGLDIPVNKETMKRLHDVYQKIDLLEKELAAIKDFVKENEKVFAVEGPDGTSDDELKFEQDVVTNIIAGSAKK